MIGYHASLTITPTPLPVGLALLRLTLLLALDRAAQLPVAKGALIRGGFGHAFQRVVCAEPCWGNAASCPNRTSCAYHLVFEPTRAADSAGPLADQHDLPRPFAIQLPDDPRTQFAAGDTLRFGLTLVGTGTAHLTQFVLAAAQLGALGLGQERAPATLTHVAARDPWSAAETPIYQRGTVLRGTTLPQITTDDLAARMISLPMHARLTDDELADIADTVERLVRFL